MLLLSKGRAKRQRRWLSAAAVVVSSLLLLTVGAVGAVLVLGDEGQAPVPSRPRDIVHDDPLTGVFRGTDPERVEAYEAWLGRPVDVVVDFPARDSWRDISRPDYLLEAWANGDATLSLAVAMLPDDDGSATIEAGGEGAYDEYFRTLAERLVMTGHEDAILRVGWEFNLDGSRWSTSNKDAWIAYWRRIVETMRSVEGQEFRFDWNPNNGDGNRYDAVEYYPGDDVVDFIGVDVYDVSGRSGTYPYPDDCDQRCRNDRQRAAWDRQIYGGDRGLNFWADFATQRGKQLSLPEWGLWSREDGTGGGENPFFIERMHEFINDPDNGVAYEAYFEYNAPNGEHRLMTDFERSGELFRWLWMRDK